MRASARSAFALTGLVLVLVACSEDPSPGGADVAATTPPAATSASAVDLRAAVGQPVDLVATVDRVLHANAFVVRDGHVGPDPVLVITGVLPQGIEAGKTVHIKGRPVLDSATGSDLVMNELKAAGPIIEAEDVRLS